MAKRILLDIHHGPVNYTFIGLSTQLKDYRLTFYLNKIPSFHFARITDLAVRLARFEEQAEYSLYSSHNDEALNTCYLLSNRNADHILVPSLKQMDYFLIFDGSLKEQEKNELLAAFRAIPNLQLAAEVNPERVRQFESLISDMELHLMNET